LEQSLQNGVRFARLPGYGSGRFSDKVAPDARRQVFCWQIDGDNDLVKFASDIEQVPSLCRICAELVPKIRVADCVPNLDVPILQAS